MSPNRSFRELFWNIARRILFSIDAETAHRATVALIRVGIRLGCVPLRWVSGGEPPALRGTSSGPVVFGQEFGSRLGLAAGFDKDAEILRALPALGFGFAEIGTVTPRPQPGNQRPRLFRDPGQGALFNRMGFNGLGASVVSERLAAARPLIPERFRVGVNLGKNKDTPLEEAASDYARAASAFEGLADYMVINVSSPNTQGLRSLQSIDALRLIVGRVNEVITRWGKRPPLLLKIAPEIQGEALAELIRAVEPWGIDGWILTNTLGGAWTGSKTGPMQGGWSGGPLRESARASLKQARGLTRLPLISVGGILDAEEAAERVRLGADLIQIYSGWVMRGPGFPREISRILKN